MDSFSQSNFSYLGGSSSSPNKNSNQSPPPPTIYRPDLKQYLVEFINSSSSDDNNNKPGKQKILPSPSSIVDTYIGSCIAMTENKRKELRIQKETEAAKIKREQQEEEFNNGTTGNFSSASSSTFMDDPTRQQHQQRNNNNNNNNNNSVSASNINYYKCNQHVVEELKRTEETALKLHAALQKESEAEALTYGSAVSMIKQKKNQRQRLRSASSISSSQQQSPNSNALLEKTSSMTNTFQSINLLLQEHEQFLFAQQQHVVQLPICGSGQSAINNNNDNNQRTAQNSPLVASSNNLLLTNTTMGRMNSLTAATNNNNNNNTNNYSNNLFSSTLLNGTTSPNNNHQMTSSSFPSLLFLPETTFNLSKTYLSPKGGILPLIPVFLTPKWFDLITCFDFTGCGLDDNSIREVSFVFSQNHERRIKEHDERFLAMMNHNNTSNSNSGRNSPFLPNNASFAASGAASNAGSQKTKKTASPITYAYSYTGSQASASRQGSLLNNSNNNNNHRHYENISPSSAIPPYFSPIIAISLDDNQITMAAADDLRRLRRSMAPSGYFSVKNNPGLLNRFVDNLMTGKGIIISSKNVVPTNHHKQNSNNGDDDDQIMATSKNLKTPSGNSPVAQQEEYGLMIPKTTSREELSVTSNNDDNHDNNTNNNNNRFGEDDKELKDVVMSYSQKNNYNTRERAGSFAGSQKAASLFSGVQGGGGGNATFTYAQSILSGGSGATKLTTRRKTREVEEAKKKQKEKEEKELELLNLEAYERRREILTRRTKQINCLSFAIENPGPRYFPLPSPLNGGWLTIGCLFSLPGFGCDIEREVCLRVARRVNRVLKSSKICIVPVFLGDVEERVIREKIKADQKLEKLKRAKDVKRRKADEMMMLMSTRANNRSGNNNARRRSRLAKMLGVSLENEEDDDNQNMNNNDDDSNNNNKNKNIQQKEHHFNPANSEQRQINNEFDFNNYDYDDNEEDDDIDDAGDPITNDDYDFELTEKVNRHILAQDAFLQLGVSIVVVIATEHSSPHQLTHWDFAEANSLFGQRRAAASAVVPMMYRRSLSGLPRIFRSSPEQVNVYREIADRAGKHFSTFGANCFVHDYSGQYRGIDKNGVLKVELVEEDPVAPKQNNNNNDTTSTSSTTPQQHQKQSRHKQKQSLAHFSHLLSSDLLAAAGKLREMSHKRLDSRSYAALQHCGECYFSPSEYSVSNNNPSQSSTAPSSLILSSIMASSSSLSHHNNNNNRNSSLSVGGQRSSIFNRSSTSTTTTANNNNNKSRSNSRKRSSVASFLMNDDSITHNHTNNNNDDDEKDNSCDRRSSHSNSNNHHNIHHRQRSGSVSTTTMIDPGRRRSSSYSLASQQQLAKALSASSVDALANSNTMLDSSGEHENDEERQLSLSNIEESASNSLINNNNNNEKNDSQRRGRSNSARSQQSHRSFGNNSSSAKGGGSSPSMTSSLSGRNTSRNRNSNRAMNPEEEAEQQRQQMLQASIRSSRILLQELMTNSFVDVVFLQDDPTVMGTIKYSARERSNSDLLSIQCRQIYPRTISALRETLWLSAKLPRESFPIFTATTTTSSALPNFTTGASSTGNNIIPNKGEQQQLAAPNNTTPSPATNRKRRKSYIDFQHLNDNENIIGGGDNNNEEDDGQHDDPQQGETEKDEEGNNEREDLLEDEDEETEEEKERKFIISHTATGHFASMFAKVLSLSSEIRTIVLFDLDCLLSDVGSVMNNNNINTNASLDNNDDEYVREEGNSNTNNNNNSFVAFEAGDSNTDAAATKKNNKRKKSVAAAAAASPSPALTLEAAATFLYQFSKILKASGLRVICFMDSSAASPAAMSEWRTRRNPVPILQQQSRKSIFDSNTTNNNNTVGGLNVLDQSKIKVTSMEAILLGPILTLMTKQQQEQEQQSLSSSSSSSSYGQQLIDYWKDKHPRFLKVLQVLLSSQNTKSIAVAKLLARFIRPSAARIHLHQRSQFGRKKLLMRFSSSTTDNNSKQGGTSSSSLSINCPAITTKKTREFSSFITRMVTRIEKESALFSSSASSSCSSSPHQHQRQHQHPSKDEERQIIFNIVNVFLRNEMDSALNHNDDDNDDDTKDNIINSNNNDNNKISAFLHGILDQHETGMSFLALKYGLVSAKDSVSSGMTTSRHKESKPISDSRNNHSSNDESQQREEDQQHHHSDNFVFRELFFAPRMCPTNNNNAERNKKIMKEASSMMRNDTTTSTIRQQQHPPPLIEDDEEILAFLAEFYPLLDFTQFFEYGLWSSPISLATGSLEKFFSLSSSSSTSTSSSSSSRHSKNKHDDKNATATNNYNQQQEHHQRRTTISASSASALSLSLLSKSSFSLAAVARLDSLRVNDLGAYPLSLQFLYALQEEDLQVPYGLLSDTGLARVSKAKLLNRLRNKLEEVILSDPSKKHLAAMRVIRVMRNNSNNNDDSHQNGNENGNDDDDDDHSSSCCSPSCRICSYFELLNKYRPLLLSRADHLLTTFVDLDSHSPENSFYNDRYWALAQYAVDSRETATNHALQPHTRCPVRLIIARTAETITMMKVFHRVVMKSANHGGGGGSSGSSVGKSMSFGNNSSNDDNSTSGPSRRGSEFGALSTRAGSSMGDYRQLFSMSGDESTSLATPQHHHLNNNNNNVPFATSAAGEDLFAMMGTAPSKATLGTGVIARDDHHYHPNTTTGNHHYSPAPSSPSSSFGLGSLSISPSAMNSRQNLLLKLAPGSSAPPPFTTGFSSSTSSSSSNPMNNNNNNNNNEEGSTGNNNNANQSSDNNSNDNNPSSSASSQQPRYLQFVQSDCAMFGFLRRKLPSSSMMLSPFILQGQLAVFPPLHSTPSNVIKTHQRLISDVAVIERTPSNCPSVDHVRLCVSGCSESLIVIVDCKFEYEYIEQEVAVASKEDGIKRDELDETKPLVPSDNDDDDDTTSSTSSTDLTTTTTTTTLDEERKQLAKEKQEQQDAKNKTTTTISIKTHKIKSCKLSILYKYHLDDIPAALTSVALGNTVVIGGALKPPLAIGGIDSSFRVCGVSLQVGAQTKSWQLFPAVTRRIVFSCFFHEDLMLCTVDAVGCLMTWGGCDSPAPGLVLHSVNLGGGAPLKIIPNPALDDEITVIMKTKVVSVELAATAHIFDEIDIPPGPSGTSGTSACSSGYPYFTVYSNMDVAWVFMIGNGVDGSPDGMKIIETFQPSRKVNTSTNLRLMGVEIESNSIGMKNAAKMKLATNNNNKSNVLSGSSTQSLFSGGGGGYDDDDMSFFTDSMTSSTAENLLAMNEHYHPSDDKKRKNKYRHHEQITVLRDENQHFHVICDKVVKQLSRFNSFGFPKTSEWDRAAVFEGGYICFTNQWEIFWWKLE